MSNIYLLKRTDTVAYDEYDSFVVVANDFDGAVDVVELVYDPTDEYGPWATRDNVLATKIGQADDKTPRIILGSFNAG